jgi:hypothetical protein
MAQQSEQTDTASQYPSEFLSGKRKAAEHFYRQSLPELRALAEDVKAGKGTLMAMSSEEF